MPLIFYPIRRVILCLLFFPPVYCSLLKLMVLFRSNCQTSPVSSRLKTLSAENCLDKGWRTCCCYPRRDRKSTAPALPCTALNMMLQGFLKLSSQLSLAMKSGMCINLTSFKVFSLIRLLSKGRFCPLACFSDMSTPSLSFEC